MERAEVMTPHYERFDAALGDNGENVWEPLVSRDYSLSRFTSVQIPRNNPRFDPDNGVYLVEAEPAVMDAIAADSNYTILEGTRQPLGVVLTSLDTVPTQSEYVQWRSRVLGMLNPDTGKKIWNEGQFNQTVGPTPSGRTWDDIHEDLRAALADLPKAAPYHSYIIEPASLAGQWRGYRADEGLGEISDAGYRGMVITAAYSGFGPNAGTFVLTMARGVDSLPQDYFYEVVIQGTSLLAADAVYADNQWAWVGTSVALEVGVDTDMNIVQAPPEVLVFAMTAADLGSNYVGYTRNGAGTLAPDNLDGAPIARIGSHPALGGTFVFDLELNTIPLPRDLFMSIRVDGIELFTVTATFDQDTQQWSWTKTGFQFLPGDNYVLEIRR